MVFSSSAQSVGISDVPSAFSVYSSITTDEHIATLINDTITSTTKTWSSQKSVSTFPVINDEEPSTTRVYSSVKTLNTFPTINDASASASKVYSSNKVDALISGVVGQSFSSNVFPFLVDTITGTNVPSGYLRYDSATQTSSAFLRFSWYTAQTVDVKRFMLATIPPSNIVIFEASNTNNYQIFEVNGIATTGLGGGAWVSFPVAFVQSGGTGTSGFALDTQIIMGIQSVGQIGSTGAQGSPGLSSSLFEYKLDRNSIVIGSGMGSGDIRFNNADLTLATTIWIDHLDDFGNDVERFVSQLSDGSQVIIQDKNNSGNFAIYDVDSSSLVAGSYVALTVVYDSGAGLASLVNAHPVFLALQFSISQTFAVGTTTTLSPGSSATVVNVGSQNDIILDFGLPQGATGATGATGASGTSVDLEFAFTQASYYGTVPTFNLFNMASGSVVNIGGSLTIGTNTGVNQLTKTYHVKSNVSSVVNGASSGWVGTGTFQPLFVGQGWKVSYSFGLLDTTTNASTRTIIGLGNFNSAVVLNATTTVASLTNQFIGVIQETGESVFSFYTRGTGTTTPTASTVACTTPNVGWYTLVLHNDVNSNNVIITLKHVSGGVATTATQTYVCGGANTLSTSQACYPIMQRSMSSAGGTTGSAIMAMNSMRFYTR